MKTTLLIASCAISLAGCATSEGPPRQSGTHSVADAGYQVDPVEFGPNQTLWAALYAFREGRGAWPVSPKELCPSGYMQATVGLMHYQGLRFTPLPDGRLDLYYEQLRNPHTGIRSSDYHTVLAYPPA